MSIGNFDGVHRGHQALISTLTSQAQLLKCPSVVVTFDPHPLQVLKPEKTFFRLFDREDQFAELSKRRVDILIEQKFTSEFAQLTAQEFLLKTVLPYLKPKHFVVGHDFVFGAGRSGNHQYLRKFCTDNQIGLDIVPAVMEGNLPISSTRIRDALLTGEPHIAELLLGRKFYFTGKVEHGQKRGHQLGVPTANLHPDVDFIPRLGVYFTNCKIQNKKYSAITNIGKNPTFESSEKAPIRIETHIFDFSEQIYGQEINVELCRFHRDEKKFSGLEELKKQIQSDLESARRYFATN